MNRSLLVLGASRYQLEVIQRAKALGYTVFATDNVPENPGHRLADEGFLIDTTDVAAVVELAKKMRPSGVVAPCTDVAVTTAAHVAEALGLTGIPPAAARVLTSKIRFRELLGQEGMPTPAFQTVDVTTRETSLGGALVVKPEGSSGSKGVFIVQGERELLERLPVTLSFSPSRRGVVEQCIEGAQCTCEGVLVDGKVALALVTDRATAEPPYVVTMGHFVPSRIGDAARSQTIAAIEKVLATLGVRTSIFDCDFVIDAAGVPYLLELTPRLGGNSLTRLVRAALGVDLAEVAIALACGEPLALAPSLITTPTAQLILGVPRDGRLHYDASEASRLRALPWLVDLAFDHPLGHPVEAFINGRHRVGEATVVAATRDELDDHVRELRTRLALATT